MIEVLKIALPMLVVVSFILMTILIVWMKRLRGSLDTVDKVERERLSLTISRLNRWIVVFQYTATISVIFYVFLKIIRP